MIIDFGITENFITKDYINSRKYLIKSKEKLYELMNLNNIFLNNN